MKKLIMSAMFVASMFTLSHQAEAQKGLSVSVKGTPQFSFLQNEDEKSLDKKATFKSNFGVGAGYNFDNNYGVGADVLYSFQGQKYKVAGQDIQQHLEYIKVPVYFSYNTDPSKNVSFYGKIGPQVSFLTNATYEANGQRAKDKERFNNATFGGAANIGAQFKLASKVYLQTGLYFDYDFTDAENKDHVSYTVDRASTHAMNAGVQVGLKYQF